MHDLQRRLNEFTVLNAGYLLGNRLLQNYGIIAVAYLKPRQPTIAK
jgi:hypothetical protein